MLSGSCDDLVDADRRCCGGVDLKSSDDDALLWSADILDCDIAGYLVSSLRKLSTLSQVET